MLRGVGIALDDTAGAADSGEGPKLLRKTTSDRSGSPG